MRLLECTKEMSINRTRSKNALHRYSSLILFSFLIVFRYSNILAQDLVVTDNIIFEDTTIVLDGNLIIKDSGKLTLNSAKIKMNCQFEGQYGVFVNNSGSLNILNKSKLTTTDNGSNYAMVCNGREFKMQNSILSGAGWGIFEELQGYPDDGSKGPFITSPVTVIDSSEIMDCYIGLILACDSAIVTNNKIHSCVIGGIKLLSISHALIKNNWIKDDEAMGLIEAKGGYGNQIINNQLISPYVEGATQCIRLFGTHHYLIEGNYLDTGGIALWLWGSDDNTIINNTIDYGEIAIFVWGWNNRIENNTLDHYLEWSGDPIYMTFAYNTQVINNRILNVHNSDCSGIYLRHSSNNLIMDNEIQVMPPNNFQDKTRGIFVTESSRHNILHSNKVNGSSYGIFLSYSSNDNKLYNNEVADIRFQGLVIDDADSNFVYSNNNLINIGIPPFDDGNNSWDYTGAEPEFTTVAKPELTNFYEKRITGQEVIENQTVNFHFAELAEGASLIIRNSTLIMGMHPSDMSYIDLQPNATLEVYDSKILHHEYGGGFTMDAGSGSNFILKNSEIRGAGHEWYYSGTFIMADNSDIENCTFYETSVIFQNCHGGKFINNKVLHSYTGILFENGDVSNVLISGNIIDGAIRSGISGHGENTNITIKNNQIKNIWGDGLEGYAFSNSIIEDNTIYNVYGPFSGINSIGGNSKTINNRIYNCYFGIYNNPENAEILGNNISQCNIGLLLREFGQSLSSNHITHCDVGIYLNTQKNTLKNLVISDCDTGIYISKISDSNVIFGNDFIDNKTQVVSNHESPSNEWDSHGTGNFWSDYIGSDANKDGIGDTPYQINTDTWDRFPLMLPANTPFNPVYTVVAAENILTEPVNAGSIGVLIAKLSIQVALEDSGETAILRGIRIDKDGNGEDSDISLINVWLDSDSNASFSVQNDSLICQGKFNQGAITIIFQNEETLTSTATCLFITINIADMVSDDFNSTSFSCKDSTYFIMKFPGRMKNANFPLLFADIAVFVQQEHLQPLIFKMEQNYPNPFNPETTISYQIAKATEVNVDIYNLVGQKIVTLVNQKQESGPHVVTWDGRDLLGRTVASGVYIYRIKTAEFVNAKKLALIR